MSEVFGIPTSILLSQLLLGFINGAFYALLSLGLALIFGLLNVINFAHGAQYMMGAFCAYLMLNWLEMSFWWALLLGPIIVGLLGMAIEVTLLRPIYKLDHLYGLLLTFGVTLVIEGVFREFFGAAGLPYEIPAELVGAVDLGFMMLPLYRGWVVLSAIVVCFAIWLWVERTRLGATLRAATENPQLTRAFGINVPRLITFAYGLGAGLAAFSGVLAAPIYQVSPLMGSNLMIIVFAVVVIGGMGSIFGSIITGLGLGLVEGLTKVLYPEGSSTVIFVIMALVLLVKPTGLFGRR
jgi:branched-chain amino acid transport system permease protein